MINWIYLTYFVVFILLVILVPPLIKRVYYQRLMQDIERRDFTKFNKHLDSMLAKLSFSAFEREAIRLNMLEATEQKDRVDKQIQFMEHMRLRRKQRAQLGEQGFYVYLAQGKIKKAQHMMDLVKEYGTPQQLEPLEIQYSILFKKEAKYIDKCKERLKSFTDSEGNAIKGMETSAGIFQYLIALQYSYDHDLQNTRKWAKLAKQNTKGTPYEEDVRKLLHAN